MKNPSGRSLVVCAGVALGIVGIAFGAHNEPVAARSFKTALIKAYPPCTAPNTTTSNGFPACMPITPSDPSCDFGPDGKGTAVARVLTGSVHDVQLKATLRGLAPNCEGATLTGFVAVRATVDDCGSASCTVPDIPDVPIGTCVVTGGICKIKATASGALPGTLLTGRTTGLEILGCGVMNGSLRTFSCGLFVP